MSVAPDQAIITVPQARAMEDAAPDVRLELIDGVLYAMGRASPWHAVMTGAIHTSLGAQLLGRCRVANKSLAVGVSAEEPTFLHPDLSVLCGPVAYHPQEPSVVLGPSLVVEVLSPGTALRDWQEKLPKYKSMSGLDEILYVDHAARRFTVYLRTGAGWEEIVRAAGRLHLRHTDVELDIDALYEEAAVVVGGPP